jgi:hypothetical protein
VLVEFWDGNASFVVGAIVCVTPEFSTNVPYLFHLSPCPLILSFSTPQSLHMETNADNAKNENQTLREAFDIREKKCFEVLREEQASFDELAKLRVKRAVVADTMIFEDQNAASLLRQKVQQERVRNSLEEQNVSLQEENVLLYQQAAFKKALAAELDRLQQELTGVRKQRKKACRAATLQAHLLIDQGMAIVERSNPLKRSRYSRGSGSRRGSKAGSFLSNVMAETAASMAASAAQQSVLSVYSTGAPGTHRSQLSRERDAVSQQMSLIDSIQESELTVDPSAVWRNTHSNCGQVFSSKTKKYLIKLAMQHQQPSR